MLYELLYSSIASWSFPRSIVESCTARPRMVSLLTPAQGTRKVMPQRSRAAGGKSDTGASALTARHVVGDHCVNTAGHQGRTSPVCET